MSCFQVAQRSKVAIIKFQLILPNTELHTQFLTRPSTSGSPAGKGLDSMDKNIKPALFVEHHCTSENSASCGFRLEWGKFGEVTVYL